jgi:hypothetical protein
MPIERFKEGTGLTAKPSKRYTYPLTEGEEEDLRVHLERIGKISTFEAKMAVLEERARKVLQSSDLPTDGSAQINTAQSREWYANQIIKQLKLIQARRTRLLDALSELEGFKKGEKRKQGEARRRDLEGLIVNCLWLGITASEAEFKDTWEADTELGIKDRRGRVKGAQVVRKQKLARDRSLCEQAEVYRKSGKTNATEIARFIRKNAGHEIKNADRKGISQEERKLWASINNLSVNRIRRIIAK